MDINKEQARHIANTMCTSHTEQVITASIAKINSCIRHATARGLFSCEILLDVETHKIKDQLCTNLVERGFFVTAGHNLQFDINNMKVSDTPVSSDKYFIIVEW